MLAKPILILTLFVLSAGCKALKKSAAPDYSQYIYENDAPPDVAIVNDSTRNPDAEVVQIKGSTPEKAVAAQTEAKLKNKYASFLKTKPDQIRDIKLYSFIDDWLYTPYLWAGTTKNGIDCSAFIQRLFSDVYKIRIPRTSVQQFFTQNVERFKVRRQLAKGDLVFFRTLPGTYVSHVGMYLDNNMFVNSSSSKGVSIASLNDPYWSSKYVGAGRLIVNKSVRVE